MNKRRNLKLAIQKEKNYMAMCEEYVKNKSSIRVVAKKNNISKSALHNFIIKKLINLNYSLYLKCREQSLYNISVRHIRGGIATKAKYKKYN